MSMTIVIKTNFYLHNKLLAVLCVFKFKATQSPQHVITHMRNNNPLAMQGLVALQQCSIIQMIFPLLQFSNTPVLLGANFRGPLRSEINE